MKAIFDFFNLLVFLIMSVFGFVILLLKPSPSNVKKIIMLLVVIFILHLLEIDMKIINYVNSIVA